MMQKVHKRPAHWKQKSAYDNKNREESFAVGDRVWLFVLVMKKGRTKKLSSLWRGPYTVVEKLAQ